MLSLGLPCPRSRAFARRNQRNFRSSTPRTLGLVIALEVIMGWAKIAVGVIGMAGIVAACGGDPGSKFGKDGKSDPNDPFTPGGMINGGNPPPDLSKCATSSATPTPIPVNLVFMFDQSGSMGQD